MGNNRHPTADSQNERRRSANMARADASAHRQRLAHLPDRKTHAVELQGLNGLCLALTLFVLILVGNNSDPEPGEAAQNWIACPALYNVQGSTDPSSGLRNGEQHYPCEPIRYCVQTADRPNTSAAETG